MKNILTALCLLSVTTASLAEPLPPTSVKGTMDIKFKTHEQPGVKGVQDVYSININVANSTVFHGTILDTPQILEGYFSKTVTQPRSLKYDMGCDVVNPKNPAQTKNVGSIHGSVGIGSDGVYNYDSGSLVMDILPMGSFGGSTDKFRGVTAGKPLARPANWLDTLQREAVNITRSVNGKVTTITLKKYDKMEFRQCVLAAGPVGIYQSVTANGEMLYDYDKACWFFNNVLVEYPENGVRKSDHLTGTIRWVESPQRKTTGEGEYQFDVRVNEPPPNVNAAFESSASDESAFFTTDATVPALTGTMKYKDVIRPGDGVTLHSNVTIDLAGNNITKQQVMALTKIVVFAAVVPMNSD